MEIEFVIALLLLGAFVGFVAGTLGIGGGAILVPILTPIFLAKGIALENVIHLVFGTSMATIIFTSFSSMKAHNAVNGVIWNIVASFAPGILFGTFLATFIASKLSFIYLTTIFTIFMAYVSIQMFLNIKPKANKQLSGKTGLFLAGSGIGSISALVSIGGGMLTVPYLVWNNIEIKKAIGTSAAIGFPLSIGATLGYLINGWSNTSLENYTLGFIHLPSVILISIASYFMAPLGAKMAHSLSVGTLKKVFGILVSILSIKMFISVVYFG